MPVRFGEMLRELDAPLGEVREHQHPLAGREHRVDDLLEARELARATGERPVVVLVRRGWLQICLSAVIAARI